MPANVFRFAKKRLRGKMLTAVFACQPLGYLGATLVALMAAARQRDGIPSDSSITTCNDSCMKTLDSIWRWIIGAGVIPAFFALWFRLTIIESPRYTADVLRDSSKAAAELKKWALRQSHASTVSNTSSVVRPKMTTSAPPPPTRRSSSGQASAAESGASSGEAYEDTEPTPGPVPNPQSTQQAAFPLDNLNHRISSRPLPDDHPEDNIPIEQAPLGPRRRVPTEASRSSRDVSPMHRPNPEPPAAAHTPLTHGLPSRPHMLIKDPDQPPKPSWADFKVYFWRQGNFRTLITTSFCWFCIE
jgi:PHS family inorganic phosphate transporter-like MFS transporter